MYVCVCVRVPSVQVPLLTCGAIVQSSAPLATFSILPHVFLPPSRHALPFFLPPPPSALPSSNIQKWERAIVRELRAALHRHLYLCSFLSFRRSLLIYHRTRTFNNVFSATNKTRTFLLGIGKEIDIKWVIYATVKWDFWTAIGWATLQYTCMLISPVLLREMVGWLGQ